ncbi:S1 family peptidase [Saccharopolyspora sp. NPDC000995]
MYPPDTLDEGLVATCAHAVRSFDDITAQFPLLGSDECAVEVVDRDDSTDIAVLRLLDPPDGVVPVPVRFDTDVLGHRFRVPGFTSAEPEGVWVEGKLRTNVLTPDQIK